MAPETVTVYYLPVNGRMFIIPERDDIEYFHKVYEAKAKDLGVQIGLEEGKESPDAARIQSLTTEKKIYGDLIDANKRLESQRTSLLARPEITEKIFEWTPPNWGMVSQLNSKYRTLVGDRHVVDQMMVNFDLLSKCVPDVNKEHPVFADFFLARIRRFTEVNSSDLPFI